ncbi:MAG: lantibiotic dehydratase [Kofleriaceae bacterium]
MADRHVLHTAVAVMLRTSSDVATSKARQHEQLIANYTQRYCVKNDTIGFFGPVGWARIGATSRVTTVAPGPQLLASRTVYFEHWGIDVLATMLGQDPAVRPQVAPRRHPFVRLEGTTLYHPIGRKSELPYEFARVLAACDGERSAREVASALLADPELGLTDESEVFEMLEDLVAQHAVIWSLDVPTHVEHPDRVLVKLLERAPDQEAVAGALAIVEELVAARDALARAAGDPDAVDRALHTLEERFTTSTQAAASRRAGTMYAGRGLVYEDCRRDLAIELDPIIFDRLRDPLALVFMVARWFTYTLAVRYRDAFVALHSELARGRPAQGGAVDFLVFWERANEFFAGGHGDPPPLVAGVVDELQRRWSELLGIDAAMLARPHIELASRDLLPQLAALFAAPSPGWPSARHHSPDLMIGARDVEALRKGEVVLVLGELHLAVANLAPWILHQHPAPDELLAHLDRERLIPIVEPIISKDRAARADQFSLLPKDFVIAVAVAGSTRPTAQVLDPSSLVIERDGDSLCLATLDGSRRFAFEQAFDWFLTNDSAPHFRLFPSSIPHTPRIALDGVVISRETWRFTGDDLAFARIDDPLERLVAVRRWARTHHIPRLSFYKVPHETKPCYLDLDSPHFVEQLAHQARQASKLTVSEMLPTPDQCWLPDASGERYTSELRMVGVDSEVWRDPGTPRTT